MANNFPNSGLRQLIRIRLTVARWPNHADRSSRKLVATIYLTGVNQALDAYVAFVKRHTLPTVSPGERLVESGPQSLPFWLLTHTKIPVGSTWKDLVKGSAFGLNVAGHQNHPLQQLVQELHALELQWPAVQQQALQANWSKHQTILLPTAEERWQEFSLACEVLSETDTLATLTKFSMFQPPQLPEPDRCDALHGFEEMRRLEQLCKDKNEGIHSWCTYFH